MYQLSEKRAGSAERGGTSVKLLLILLVLILIGNAGYNYVPVAYQAENFKQDMQKALIQGIALPPVYGRPTDNIKDKIMRAAKNNDLPPEIFINVADKNGLITARVYYTKKIPVLPFKLYEYEYVFDHVAAPNGFLTE